MDFGLECNGLGTLVFTERARNAMDTFQGTGKSLPGEDAFDEASR